MIATNWRLVFLVHLLPFLVFSFVNLKLIRFPSILELKEFDPFVEIMFDVTVNSFKNYSHIKNKTLFVFLQWFQTQTIFELYYSTQLMKFLFLCCLYCMSKRSMTHSRHCHHNEALSMCQEAAKVPNICVAKVSICGFLGVALAANWLSVRALVQKALRFVCCWFFLETCGFVTSTVILWAMLLYCLTLS